mmetsp:Transcript_23786/g.46598  ORF Transcript_23786/g.46598 Transcript_23786/m.46598 type:complete len:261 (-) Transcript_23786:1024-1806(-)
MFQTYVELAMFQDHPVRTRSVAVEELFKYITDVSLLLVEKLLERPNLLKSHTLDLLKGLSILVRGNSSLLRGLRRGDFHRIGFRLWGLRRFGLDLLDSRSSRSSQSRKNADRSFLHSRHEVMVSQTSLSSHLKKLGILQEFEEHVLALFGFGLVVHGLYKGFLSCNVFLLLNGRLGCCGLLLNGSLSHRERSLLLGCWLRGHHLDAGPVLVAESLPRAKSKLVTSFMLAKRHGSPGVHGDVSGFSRGNTLDVRRLLRAES